MNFLKLMISKQLVGLNPRKSLGRTTAATIVCLLMLLNGKVYAAWQGEALSMTASEQSCGGWKIVQTKLEGVSLRVHIPTDGRQPNRGYVICHGMDGTVSQDRFEQLAKNLAQRHPDAAVAQIDWSSLSKAKCLSLPVPWTVAHRIPSVAEACYEVIVDWRLTSEQWVFVGESFGNNVNALLSERLGNQSTLVAFNPASDLGGGGCLDLRKCSLRSYAFQTDSTYDTWRSVAHRDVFLVAADSSSDLEKHTYGVQWFVDQLEALSLDVFDILEQLPLTDSQLFTASIDASGQLLQVQRPRFPQEQGHGKEANHLSPTQTNASNSSTMPSHLAQVRLPQ